MILRRIGRGYPALAVWYVATLAIGLGTLAALASLLFGLGYRPLPFRQPARLVAIWERGDPGPAVEAISAPDLADMAAGARNSLASLGLFIPDQLALLGRGGATPLGTCAIPLREFRVLGLRPVLGRGLGKGDAPAGPGVLAPALISRRLWRARYAGNPAILGRVLRIGRNPRDAHAWAVRIVGVVPSGAGIPLPFAPSASTVDLWYRARDMSGHPRRQAAFFGVARLRPGATLAQARAALLATTRRLGQRFAFERHKLPVVESFTAIADGPARRTAGLLVLGVALVFLLAYLSLVVLMVAEADRRRRGIAIRAALGATRWHLWSEIAIEKCALTGLAVVLGLALAFPLLRWLGQMVPAAGIGAPLRHPAPMLAAVPLAFAAVAFAGALLWSALLSRSASGTSGGGAILLSSGAPGPSAAPTARSWRLILLAAQAGVAMCLFAAAALAARTYAARSSADLGPAPGRTVLFSVAPRTNASLDAATILAFKHRVLTRLGRVPGVQATALADTLPPDGTPASFVKLSDPLGEQRTATPAQAVSAGFFNALGIPILYGRSLQRSDDRRGAPPVAVISLEMATRNWPSPGRAVGTEIALGASLAQRYRIVGVVGNFGGFWFDPPVPEIYVPEVDSWYPGGTVILRDARSASAVPALARQALAGMPLPAAISAATTMRASWRATLTRPAARSAGMLLLALLGLALTVQGVYAVSAAMVQASRHDLAVRMALGASPARTALSLAAAIASSVGLGGTLGAIAMIAAQPLLARGIGGAAGPPLASILAAAALMVLAAAAGSYLPARAAVRLEPVEFLRQG
jgi:predicted permease